jgi:ectoine hydroxylase-related dioxygenase (phytanoyl-CoA dioxygenase family)
MTIQADNLPWTESPFFERELEESALSPEDKAFVKDFADNGYAVFDPGLDMSLIDELIATMKPRFDKIIGDDKRLQDAWMYNEYVKKTAVSDIVLDRLRLLYRREPIPFQTLSFQVGTQQKTHSDMVHFNSIPQRFMCGVWVALEDITEDNGPLHYYPGSHKLPFYDMIDMGVKASDNISAKKALMAYAENYTSFIQEMIVALKLKKKTLTIKKGQAMIWSANLLHGGEKINTPGATRYSQVTHFYFADCIYYVPRLSDIAINKIYLNHLVNIRTGEKVVNKYFGKEVKPATKIQLQQSAVRMLSKIAPLFPKEIVDKIKSIIVR